VATARQTNEDYWLVCKIPTSLIIILDAGFTSPSRSSGVKAGENGSVDVGRDAWPEATAETGRIAACSDGVFTIAMTLVVLDLRPPSP